VSWAKRNPEELRQRRLEEMQADREFYQSLPRVPSSGLGRHGSSGGGSVSFTENRGGGDKEPTYGNFKNDLIDAWDNEEAVAEVKEKYIRKLYWGRGSRTTKEHAEKTVDRWWEKFLREEGY
jgi:hypothetical protein